MAEAGFVYTSQEDLVYCFHCNIKLDRWSKDMEPLVRHKEESPTCSFIRQRLQAVKGEQSLGKSSPEQRPTRLYAQSEPINNNTEGEGVSKYSLQFPDYSDQAIRLQSFKHWGGVLPAQELAEGGFYMIAHRDVVRCFSCNVVIQDWERSDSVIDEHHKHSPNCTFLKGLNNEVSPLNLSKLGQPYTYTPIIMNKDTRSSVLSIFRFETPSSDTQLPPARINSRSSSRSSDDGNEATISGNTSRLPLQSSSGSGDSSGLFVSPE